MHIQSATYVQSCTNLKGCPATDLPEFAFIGRSNVGKSSLINMITGKAKLALTSSKPGKTRNINHFIINESWYLVDLPGYGYAQISRLQRDLWMQSVREYFLKRPNLRNVFLLIDASIPPQKKDLEFANWMGQNQVPFCIVFTKTDKAKPAAMQANVDAFKAELLKVWEELPPIILSSTEKKIGKEDLLEYIEEAMEG